MFSDPQPVSDLTFEPEVQPEVVKAEPDFLRNKPKVTISNVVSNFRCRCHINLRNLAIKTKNVVYKR